MKMLVMIIVPLSFQLTLNLRQGSFSDWIALLGHLSSQPNLKPCANPALFPVAEAPPEIPRVMLTFPNLGLQFDASSLGWSLRWAELPTRNLKLDHMEKRRDLAVSELLAAAEKFNIKPVRLGSVITWAIQPEEKPAMWIAKIFFKPELVSGAPFNRPNLLEIHSHKVFKADDFDVNSWARVKSEALLQPSEDFKTPAVITFHTDLNTLAEETVERDYEQARKFFSSTWKHHRQIATLYLGVQT